MSGRVRLALLVGCLGLGALAAPDALASADLAVRGPYDTPYDRAGSDAASSPDGARADSLERSVTAATRSAADDGGQRGI